MVTILAACTLSAGVAAAGSWLGWLDKTPATVLCVASGLALVAVVGIGSARPGWQLFGPSIVRGLPGRGVALTFDDGPDPASTTRLLDALAQANASATFFLLADRVEAHPELARAVAARHEVGLHGLSHHPWLTLYSPERGAAELKDAAARVEAVTGTRPRWFRPPFGAVSPRLYEAARRAELTVVWCSVRPGDGGGIDAGTLRARCARAVDGDIVLLHDGARPAREVLPAILGDLLDRGLRPVTVGELVA